MPASKTTARLPLAAIAAGRDSIDRPVPASSVRPNVASRRPAARSKHSTQWRRVSDTHRRPSAAAQITHDYTYDGASLCQRETSKAAGAPETTRFVRTFPGGPSVYWDSDRTVDVQMTDRYGLPWYLYRAREGVWWFTDVRWGQVLISD